MKGTMLRQIGFVRRLQERLRTQSSQRRRSKEAVSVAETASLDRIDALTDEDLNIIITEFWAELGLCLRLGIRVIFEGWISFFTKPIKRNCYDMTTGKRWIEFKRRVRTRPLDRFKEIAEVAISEEQYLLETDLNKKK